MATYIGAIDSGTTSTRFMLFDQQGTVIAYDQREHQQIFPQSGWVEHDGLEIWERTRQVIGATLAKAQLSARDIAAVGITNQRETTLLWDSATGVPVHNAIVWQDTRTDRICHQLTEQGHAELFYHKTGPAGDLLLWSQNSLVIRACTRPTCPCRTGRIALW